MGRFRALVQALSALLADFSRKAEHALKDDIADLSNRLGEWDRDQGNANE